MNIDFSSKQLEKLCNNSILAKKKWGDRHAKKILLRLDDLRASDTLADVSYLPPARCHELDNNRKGTFAVDTVHPNRLIFKPNHQPIPKKSDGGIDKTLVTDILILEVEDYHE